MTRSCDVIILGGGPAGSATGLSLARSGLSVVMVERSQYGSPRIGETLPPAIKPLLISLDVWERFLRDSHLSSPTIQSAWGSDELQFQDHIYNPYGSGWHVDRARFDSMLVHCAENAGVTVFANAELISSDTDGADRWRVKVSCQNREVSIESRFVVDATGRSSFFARRRGVPRISTDHLIGVICFVAPDRCDTQDCSTLIEGSQGGWWYSALLPDSRMVLAYMTDADLYAKGQRENARYWFGALQQMTHTRSRLDGSEFHPSSLRVISANSSHLAQLSSDSWLAVGDAANAFDPLSGQGIYKALQSGILAAKQITEHLSGNALALAEYDKEMKREYARYLRRRSEFYARENRWPNSIFWQRRTDVKDLNSNVAKRTQESRTNRRTAGLWE